MMQVFNTGVLTENGLRQIRELNGRIEKVVVFCGAPRQNTKIVLTSYDGEVLCDGYLGEPVSRFYPRNVIPVSQETPIVETYAINGPLSLEIIGLGDGEGIDNIRIYYE